MTEFKLTIDTDDGEYVRMLAGIRDLRLERLSGDPTPIKLPQYSQRDPHWKGVRIGHGNTTIGAWGCLISAFGMGMAWTFGSAYPPDYVNKEMTKANGYVGINKNRWVWGKAAEVFSGIALDKLIDCALIPAPLTEINAALADGSIVLIRVDNKPGRQGVQDHWVLVTKHVITADLQDGYEVADPWPLPDEEFLKTIPPAFCVPTWSASRAIFSIVTYRRT